MAFTDIHGEDRLVQQTFAEHLRDALGWESVYAYNAETFGPQGLLGRASEREAVLTRDLRAALARLNPGLPDAAREQALDKLTRIDFALAAPAQPRVLRFHPRRRAGGVARRAGRSSPCAGTGHRLSPPRQQPLPGRARAEAAGGARAALQPARRRRPKSRSSSSTSCGDRCRGHPSPKRTPKRWPNGSTASCGSGRSACRFERRRARSWVTT